MILSGRCIYEIRVVGTNGTLSENGTVIATAEVIESEQRDTDPDKDLSWRISSAALLGHVQSIVLVDNTDKATVLYDFPIVTFPGQNVIASGFVQQSTGAKLNGFFDLLSRNRGLLIIRTDIPGRAVIEIPITVSYKEDWNRPYCS
jgi:hypothetical protein